MDAALVLRFVVVLFALGTAGYPIAYFFFPRSTRLAAGFALPTALVVVALVAYWVGQVTFGPLALAVPLVVLLGVTTATVATGRTPRLRSEWRSVAGPTLVFVAAFALLLGVRAVDPAVHPAGGEKFLDFGLIQAVLRADSLPPEDFWFAGRTVNYYYGGPLLAATLTRLSGVPAATGYNLVLVTCFGTLAAGAYVLAAEITARAGRRPAVGGAFGAAFVSLAGTLATPGRALVGLLPPEIASKYGGVFVAGIRAPREEALAATRFLAGETGYDYWLARYVIPDAPSVFPLWAFVNGDLRPHVVSASFLLLAAAICLALFRESRPRRRGLLLLVALPAVGGLLTVTNTWALPTAGGLAWLALALGEAPPSSMLPARFERLVRGGGPSWPLGELRRTIVAAILALGSVLLGAALAAPYLLFGMASNEGIHLLPPRSPFGGLVLVHGGFLALFAVALAIALPWSELVPGAQGPRRRVLAVAAGVLALAALVAVDLAAVALAGPLLAAAWIAARRRDGLGYEAALMVGGAGIILAVEFVAAKVYPYDPNAPRWNTVYKAYWQVWLLWGVAGGAALARVVGAAADALEGRRPVDWSGRLRLAGAAVGVVMILGATSFAPLALGAHFEAHGRADPTLDATAFVDSFHSDEADAIDWLADRRGTPTIASAPGVAPYQWVNGPSALTGVPTVAGWSHVIGYHGRAAYERRVRAVERLYTATDPAERRTVVERYGIEYVYVGPVERERYADVAVDGSAPWMSVAHRSGAVTIYRVESDGAG